MGQWNEFEVSNIEYSVSRMAAQQVWNHLRLITALFDAETAQRNFES